MLVLLAAAALAALPQDPWKSEPTVGGAPETARTLGMGDAVRAEATGIDALFFNPAGMSLAKRYVIEGGYSWDQFSGAHRPLIGLVDSQTTVVAAGFAYAYEYRWVDGTHDPIVTHRVRFGLSYTSTYFAVGSTFKYDKSTCYHCLINPPPTDPTAATRTAEQAVDASPGFNDDVGVAVMPIPQLTLSAVGYNIASAFAKAGTVDYLQPFAVGGGASFHLAGFLLDADIMANFVKNRHPTQRYNFGAEYAIGGVVPVRAGFIIDRVSGDNLFSVGTGYSGQSFGVDVGYRQSVNPATAATHRAISVSLRYQM